MKILIILSIVLSSAGVASLANADDSMWSCVTSYDCGQGGFSYKDYFGHGVSADKQSAQAAAKADAARQCEAECASLAKPPYTHPTCQWGANGSCTYKTGFDLE